MDPTHVQETRPLRRVAIRRQERLWSHERGAAYRTTAGALFGGPVFGLSIHTQSEVRACRVYAGDSSPGDYDSAQWVDIVEACPVPFFLPEQAPLYIESLDRHDGDLWIQAAMTLDAVHALCVDYAPHSSITFGKETGSPLATGGLEELPGYVEGEGIVAPYPNRSGTLALYDLAPPRCAVSVDRKIALALTCDATATGAATLWSLVRDRAGNVVREDQVGTVTLSSGSNVIAAVALGPARQFGRLKLPESIRCAGRVALL